MLKFYRIVNPQDQVVGNAATLEEAKAMVENLGTNAHQWKIYLRSQCWTLNSATRTWISTERSQLPAEPLCAMRW